MKSQVMKLCCFLFLTGSIGCASSSLPVMTQMDLPPEPSKPKIQSSVIVQNSIPYICYKVPDGMELLEYLIKLKYDRIMLVNRIDAMNKLMVGK